MWPLGACLSSLVFMVVPFFQTQLLSPSVRCFFTRSSTSFRAKCHSVCSHLMKCKLGTRNATGQTLKTMFGYCCFPLANASFSWSLNHCSSILFLRGAVVGNSPFKWPIVKLYCLSPGRFSVLFWAPTSPPSNFLPSPSHTELCYSRHFPDNWSPSLQETWTAWEPIPLGPPTDSHRGQVSFYSTALLCKTNFWPSLLLTQK